jgi:hypothetical protein
MACILPLLQVISLRRREGTQKTQKNSMNFAVSITTVFGIFLCFLRNFCAFCVPL